MKKKKKKSRASSSDKHTRQIALIQNEGEILGGEGDVDVDEDRNIYSNSYHRNKDGRHAPHKHRKKEEREEEERERREQRSSSSLNKKQRKPKEESKRISLKDLQDSDDEHDDNIQDQAESYSSHQDVEEEEEEYGEYNNEIEELDPFYDGESLNLNQEEDTIEEEFLPSSSVRKYNQQQSLHPSLDFSNMKSFVTKPVPLRAGIVECYILRKKDGEKQSKMYPTYELYTKEGDLFLLTAKRRTGNKTSNYLISYVKGDLDRHSPAYLGKVRSNFMGTEYHIYDNGIREEDIEPCNPSSQIRRELGVITYASNFLRSKGPRRMNVGLPALRTKYEIRRKKRDRRREQEEEEEGPWRGKYDEGEEKDTSMNQQDQEMIAEIWEEKRENQTMLSALKGGVRRERGSDGSEPHEPLLEFVNKYPRWNASVGAYVLNFNGRVTMASVKNFQLVDPEEGEKVCLQFGRVGEDEFTMDFSYPFSPLQAFAVCLSSFDSKIACD